MIKRTLYFGNPSYLSLKDAQLLVRLPEVEKSLSPTLSKGEGENTIIDKWKKELTASIPIEDIGIVVLDHKQITITQALIAAFLENNVAFITCDATHHPHGYLMPLAFNSIQSERYRSQLDASEPLKKQLWAQTIEQKIKNQAAHLYQRGLKNDFLIPLHKNIKSGDTENAEGIAAAYYWRTLSPALLHNAEEFRRSREGLPPNNYLNYGYALLRATMARSIVGAGLMPTLGIFHRNRYNAYCLADDLMEPYRPLVDKVVCDLLHEHETDQDIPLHIKKILLNIPAMDVNIEGEKSPLMIATQRTAISLVKCFEGEQRKMVYPEFNL
jgi:CRISP-associated protein Cas1